MSYERDAFIESQERKGGCGKPHGIRIRGGGHDHTGRWREKPEDTETVREMHERIQAEIKAEQAKAAKT
jgi:hypothetical protein